MTNAQAPSAPEGDEAASYERSPLNSRASSTSGESTATRRVVSRPGARNRVRSIPSTLLRAAAASISAGSAAGTGTGRASTTTGRPGSRLCTAPTAAANASGEAGWSATASR